MLISCRWLDEWVRTYLDETELAHKLTMGGLEVNESTRVNRCHDEVVVGKVLEVATHPENPELKLCMVACEPQQTVDVVCGAPNVAPGFTYPLALPGAVIGEQEIRAKFIRGTRSEGMLCSAKELGIGEDSDRLLELNEDAPVGATLNDYLQLDDAVLDIEVTPNRADCFSVAGIAREVSILTGNAIQFPEFQSVQLANYTEMPIRVESVEDCPRYVGRMIENISTRAVTPDWMRERLRRSGLRCLHPIVDVTNYVMLELGQPMHAFDPDLLDVPGIVVRHAAKGETLELLDGSNLKLVEGTQVIADLEKPIGLAGVMGGVSTGIHAETQNVFLEAAFFTPKAARFSVRSHNIRTDASHRFERGVDPHLQVLAMERATELILKIAGGQPGPVQNLSTSKLLPHKQACMVRYNRIERVLGVGIPRNEVESILVSVNKSVVPRSGGWKVMPYSYRFDLDEEHDQIEEIARVYGYAKIPSNLRIRHEQPRNVSETAVRSAEIRDVLHHAGYFEAITYSFVDPETQQKITPSIAGKPLANPIAENLSVMRTSLWPGLFHVFHENYRRRKEQVFLYEIGRIFLPEGEKNMLGGLAYGLAVSEQWVQEKRNVDFFDIKALLTCIYDLTRAGDRVEFRAETNEGLHPGCSASIYFDEQLVGIAGQLHPTLLQQSGISEPVYVFQLEMDSLAQRQRYQFKGVSRYPAIIRDLSFLLDREIPVQHVENAIRHSAGEFLTNLNLFDVYSGTGIDFNKKSVAFRLTFRLNSRTLTDQEIDVAVEAVINQLNQEFNAKLRT